MSSDMNEPQPPQPPSGPTAPGEPAPPYVIPVRYTPQPGAAPAPPPRRRSVWTVLLVIALAVSIGFNLLLLFSSQALDFGESAGLIERFHSGKTHASDKVAIVKLDGIIMEGSLAFVQKQIEQAATDPNVKAVLLRINSPGGSITASDDLFERLKELRDGTLPQQKGGKKTLDVS